MKKLISSEELKSYLWDGMSIMVGGFMTCGTSKKVIDIIHDSGVKDITIICNDGGYPGEGVGKLISAGRVKKLITSHIGLNKEAGDKYKTGELELELVPQGTLAEKIRSKGTGIGGFLTKTGLGTVVEEGKQIITLDGVDYLLETALGADLAVLLGDTVDKRGNIVYSKTTRNFNPLMAMAADKVVVGARSIVEIGEINPENVITPHIFVDYIVEEEGHE